MADTFFAVLAHRGVLELSGEDRFTFLQGMVSNDVNRAEAGRPVWTAFLTPQGKFLHEFFVVPGPDSLLLEGEAGRLDDLRTRLSRFKLRSKIALEPRPDLAVAAVVGDGARAAVGLAGDGPGTVAFAGGVAFDDPRLDGAGARVLLPADGAAAALGNAGLAEGSVEAYDAHRVALGLPDGARDIAVEKNTILEVGFAELDGVDFKKGCYVGQEVTARTKYRGLLKKRLVPVQLDGPAPEPGTPIARDGREVGEMRSHAGAFGLAVIRLDALAAGGPMTAGTTVVTPRPPAWFPAIDPQPSP